MLPMERVVAELALLERVPALSVYLRSDAFRGGAADVAGELARLLAEARAALPGPDAGFEENAGRLGARLADMPRGSRGVALFSCAARGVLRAVPFDVPLPSAAWWTDGFVLDPLRSALERAPRILALLLDVQRARFFRVCFGEIEEAPTPVRGVAEANAAPGVPPLRAHVGRAAETLRHLTRSGRVDRLLLAGDPAALALLGEMLPSELAEQVHTAPELSADAPPARVLQEVLELLWREERDTDERLVAQLLQAAERGAAAVGPAAVAEALAFGDVQRLIVPEGMLLPGGECPACGMLTAAPAPALCTACGTPLRPVADLLQVIEQRVAGAGGEVDEVAGQAAAVLAEHEGIGAFLR